MSLPGGVFLGDCAKQAFTADGRELASVSGCLAERPPQWVDRWDFNRATCWNTEAAAWASVPENSKAEFRIYAYRLLPMLFDPSGAAAIDNPFPRDLPDLPTEPAPPHFESVGYDVVELGELGFGCSPLSCNVTAEKIPVNRVCLIDDLDTAQAAARTFGIEQPEPGPYVVIEVLIASIPRRYI